MLVGEFIKMQRKIKKMTLVELSAASGVSKSHISRIEHGATDGWDSISRLLEALGLTMADCQKAGVDWWAISGKSSPDPAPLPAAASADADFLISFVNDADEATLHALRVLVETMRGGAE